MKFTSEMKSAGFELIPEGVTILKVTEMKPNVNAGKIKDYRVTFVDSAGRKIFNTYNVNPNNKYYLQAMRSFYSLLKTGCALYEDANGESNEMEAVGCYIVAKIKHSEGNDGRVFQNLGYIITLSAVIAFQFSGLPYKTERASTCGAFVFGNL